jgi:molybdopterin molybdotransferase
VRTHVEADDDGRILAHPFPKQDSTMILTLPQADGLIRRKPFAPVAGSGDVVEIIRFRDCGGY